ncbi:PilZ domain-containing protein [Pseudomonas sp. CrR25]|nr:PilZ domain-containing protein [Pseudomonas sp. CrR25]
MTLDALRLEVPDILEEDAAPLADLNEQLVQARLQPHDTALQMVLSLLFRLNRSTMTLLERQRALQSFSDEYRHYATTYCGDAPPPALFVHLCGELAIGFKRLLLQILQGRQPSRPHLAWCLYMAQHFLAQSLLRHYQLYQEPPPGLWRDSHLLYWIGEHQECLDEPVAAAFLPRPASTLRGIYQQMLLLALSNPFHLAEGECPLLFGALAPLAGLARLLPWDEEEEEGAEGPLVDLTESQPCLGYAQKPDGSRAYLRRFELGALLVALHEPAPLQSSAERHLLERVQHHWLGRQQRRHQRAEHDELDATCNLVVGLPAIHAQLLEQRPNRATAQILDTSPDGARLLCNPDQAADLSVGQLVLLLSTSTAPTLAMVRWRHLNAEGLHLGLRYLKGLPRPAWLRRAPSAQTHPGVLQSTPAPGSGWHHGLWLPNGQFAEGENLWLQLASAHNQTVLPLPPANLSTASVARHPLRLA